MSSARITTDDRNGEIRTYVLDDAAFSHYEVIGGDIPPDPASVQYLDLISANIALDSTGD